MAADHIPVPERRHAVRELARIRQRLTTQARLFGDPEAYIAGVEDALTAARGVLGESVVELEPQPAARML